MALLLRLAVPLPAPANAGDSSVHAGQEDEQLEHDDHGGQHQAEHVARRGEPLVGGGDEEPLGAVQVGVQGAEEERQVTQLGLEGEKKKVRQGRWQNLQKAHKDSDDKMFLSCLLKRSGAPTGLFGSVVHVGRPARCDGPTNVALLSLLFRGPGHLEHLGGDDLHD